MDVNSADNDEEVDVHDLSDEDEEEVNMENIDDDVTGAAAVNDLDFIAEHAATEWSFSVLPVGSSLSADVPEPRMVVDNTHDADNDEDSSEDDHDDTADVPGPAVESSSDSDSDESDFVLDSGGKGKSELWCTEEEVLITYDHPSGCAL